MNLANLYIHTSVLSFINNLGLLDAVTELHIDIVNTSTFLISWIPPYTLEGVPILYYCVIVNNSLNITAEDTIVYHSVDIEPAQIEINIAVTVIPVNKLGKGSATTTYTNVLLQDKGIENNL